MFKYFSILFLCILLISCGKDAKQKDTSGVQETLFEAISDLIVDTSAEGKLVIKDLHQSAINFYYGNGYMPSDCYEEMEQYGTIEMKQSYIDEWEFQCDWIFDEDEGEIYGTIVATSTEKNDAGSGKTIVYDILSGEFTGYGQGY